jgi:hypothetical protein
VEQTIILTVFWSIFFLEGCTDPRIVSGPLAYKIYYTWLAIMIVGKQKILGNDGLLMFENIEKSDPVK